MRLTRSLVVSTAVAAFAALAFLPASAAAQAGRLFDNSWFWGVKGGVANFSTSAVENAMAPMVGVDWLITRRRAGLIVSVEQAFFNEESALGDEQGGELPVNIRDMRRVAITLAAFPTVWRRTLRPYAGIGFSLNFIQKAEIPEDALAPDSPIRPEAEDVVTEVKDRASIIGVLGLQAQFRKLSIFGQATLQPSQVDFLINDRAMFLFEGGIRYNIGKSIERPQ